MSGKHQSDGDEYQSEGDEYQSDGDEYQSDGDKEALKLAQKERTKLLLSEIRVRYDAGQLLFSRDIILTVLPYRERCRASPQERHEFELVSYNGRTVRCHVDPRVNYPKGDLLINTGAEMAYNSIERMLDEEIASYSPTTLSVSVSMFTSTISPKDHGGAAFDWTSPNALIDYVAGAHNEWRSSTHYALFRDIFSSASFPADITKVIGYGLGSFYLLGKLNDERCIVQHAFLATIGEILSGKDGRGKVKCYAQDPAYDKEERKVHEANGITVLDDPYGFLKLDNTSVVLSIAPNVPVKQIVLDMCRPAAMVWMHEESEDAETEEDRARLTDPESSRVRRILREEYDMTALPDHPTANWLKLYVRKPLATQQNENGTVEANGEN